MSKLRDLTAADSPGVDPQTPLRPDAGVDNKTATPTSAAEAVPAVGSPPQSGSIAGRLLGVFISPLDTFDEIVRYPNFLTPLVLYLLAAVAVTETILNRIGVERIILNQLARSARGASMTPDQLEQAARRSAGVASIVMHGSFITAPLGIAIVAAIGLAIVNVIHGGNISFRTAFAITCYANLVNVVGLLMGLPVIIWGEPDQFNPQSFIPTNLGFFLTSAGNLKFLISLVGSVDLLTIWYIILLGIGFSAATHRKVGARNISLYLFGLWGAWIVVRAALAAVG